MTEHENMIQIFRHLKLLLIMIVFQVFSLAKLSSFPSGFVCSLLDTEKYHDQAILGWTESEKQQYTTVTSHKKFFYLGVKQLSRELEKIEYTSLDQIT